MGELRRLDWVDAVKGIGIVCVIVGHMQIPEILRQFIFSFHMPLFFFVSGYLYKGEMNSRWWMSKVYSLVIPYIIYSLLFVPIRCWGFGGDAAFLIMMFVKGNGTGFTWFFTCLLMSNIIGASIIRIIGRSYFQLSVSILICMILGCVVNYLNLPNYMTIVAVFPATAIWLIGYLFQRADVLGNVVKCCWPLKSILAILLILGGAMFVFQHIDMQGGVFKNHIFFYVTSLSIIFLMFFVVERFFNKGFAPLNYCGRNSMLLFVFHGIVAITVKKIMLDLGINPDVNIVLKSLIRIANLVVLFVVVWVVNRYFPILAGKRLRQ